MTKPDAPLPAEDRRDSLRLPMRFLVRETSLTDGEWEEREGDISLGGIYWRGKTPALGREVDVRFSLRGVAKELRVRGEIIRVKTGDAGIDFHLRFTAVELEVELAIARYMDDWLRDNPSGEG
ncbi:MAG: PilZ domain-containing protein [Deltaproteobacteria bacterium]|nr:PilZ domain-containing protein [Deltaproteobacteria bacterium]